MLTLQPETSNHKTLDPVANINKWLTVFNFWIKLGGWGTHEMKEGQPSSRRALTTPQVTAIRASKLKDGELSEIFNVPKHSIRMIKDFVIYTND